MNQHKIKLEPYFVKILFQIKNPVFLKLVFLKLNFENDKEYSYELLLKTQDSMKCVCVCVCVNPKSYQPILSWF